MMSYLILVPLAIVGVVGIVLVKKGKSWGAALCVAAAVLSVGWTLLPATWFSGGGQPFGQRDAVVAEAIGKSVPDRFSGGARVLILGRGGWMSGFDRALPGTVRPDIAAMPAGDRPLGPTDTMNDQAVNEQINSMANLITGIWKKGLAGTPGADKIELVFAGERPVLDPTGQPIDELPKGPFNLAIIDTQRVSIEYPVMNVIGNTPVVLIADRPDKPEAPSTWNLPPSQVILYVHMNGDKPVTSTGG